MRALLLLGVCLLLGGCASAPKEIDDGRVLDPNLVASFQLYGQGERALRPALVRAAEVAKNKAVECDKQFELPFAVATAEGAEGDDQVAWKRVLDVDQRVAVIAAAAGSPVAPGERIVQVGRLPARGSWELLEQLGSAREEGRPFEVQLASGQSQQVTPFPVCRGYARLAPPTTPKTQDYHWLMSMHPLELPQSGPSSDEMLWAVLWTQGLSEEGGARMKTYHYTVKIGGTLLQLASLASGLNAAAKLAEVAVDEARKRAAQEISKFASEQLLKQGKELALQRLRQGLQDAAEKVTRGQAMAMMSKSAANRGALTGVGMIAATVWERADAWAFARMQELGADPLAGLRLHQKMVERELGGNAFALDAERIGALTQLAGSKGLRAQALAALGGENFDALDRLAAAMPMASSKAGFSFESADDPAAGRFARGLLDGLLHLPSASAAAGAR
jgi:hypothetical protein